MASSFQRFQPLDPGDASDRRAGGRLDLKRLIDIPALQELTDQLYEATRIPSAIITMDGEVLTGSGWQRICAAFHRRHPEIEKICLASDVAIRERVGAGEPFVIYRCPMGLVDASSPVVIDGEHVANVFAGQLFTEPPGEAAERAFRAQARRYGLDEEAYMEAFREVPVFPEERFRPALSFLANFARLVADIGLTRLRELEAMRDLRASEQRYRRLVESTHAVPWELDLATRRFTYMGPRAEQVLGWPAQSWTDMDAWASRIVEEDRAAAVSRRERETASGRDHEFDYRVRGPDGSVRWIRDVVSLVGGPGGPTSLVGFLRDVTDVKLAEQEREALRERLARAGKMEALGALAGGVAHDLNNIFGVLVGYADLLAREFSAESPVRAYAHEIREGGRRAAAIIDDLLTLARRGVPHRETVDVNALVQGFLESPEVAAARTHHPAVRVTAELGGSLLNVRGSRLHLRKSLMNLVSNALEAVSGAGEVSIRTANRYVEPGAGPQGAPEGEYVEIAIRDTGSGISPQDLPRIFEPFYTRKSMGRSGTGLGLAVVWGTVQDFEGFVDVESEPGRGSTFTLLLPACRDAVAAEPAPAVREEYRGRGERLLVVDDVSEQRALAARMLAGLGYVVRTAGSGEEAARLAAQERFELVVLDMVMEPGMDGLDTYRALAALRPGQRAVIVSGYAETERVRALQELGSCPYVRKPYLLETIGLAVRRELDRGR